MKKTLLSLAIALILSCSIVGCGSKVPTEKDLVKAYEKVEKGKMNQNEYWEMYDAYLNNEPYDDGGSFLATLGEVILVIAVVGGVTVVIKKIRKIGETQQIKRSRYLNGRRI